MKIYNKDITRIFNVYKERYNFDKKKYSLFNKGEHYMEFSYEKELISLLKKEKIDDLSKFLILEIGCGDGRRLRYLQRLGAIPNKEYGLELLDFYIRDAKLLSSNCHLCQGDAVFLPYKDEIFDIVYQRTVFTSILDFDLKKKIAQEMLRVLKPSGFILWYDFFIDNPKNPNVKAIKKEEIYKLFPNCNILLKKTTLAPPLARLLAPYSIIFCMLLEKIPLFCTHYLGIIKKHF